MKPAIVDGALEACDWILSRIDGGEPTSGTLLRARALAELIGDEQHVHWLDFEIYGAGNVPGQKTPLETAAEKRGFSLFWQLHRLHDLQQITVDELLAHGPPDPLKARSLLPNSLASIEHAASEYTEPDDAFRARAADDALRLIMLQAARHEILGRVRGYLHRFVSRIRAEAIDEMENVKLLGPDYRLVAGYANALESGVGDGLISALGLIKSDNSADWSAAALQCRNAVLELGRSLFPGKLKSYTSKMLGRELDLTGEKEKNRLTTFVDKHWTEGGRDAKERLTRCSDLIETTYSVGSKGKQGKVRQAEAQRLVVDVFELVSELDTLTGLEPTMPETGGKH